MKSLVFFSIIILIISCQKRDDYESRIIQINYGTSFGECIGYCQKDVFINSDSITYTSSGWRDSILFKTCTESLSTDIWNSLKSGLDTKKFFDLPETLGCPDCADGGAEYVEIELLTGETHKVTFEYMNEPEILKNYVIGLREQAKKSTSCIGY